MNSTIDVVDKCPFEESLFQVHLDLWRILIRSTEAAQNTLGTFASAISDGIAKFMPACEMSTGLSMERLWLIFRPTTPSTMNHFQTVLGMESLASRFDAIAWKCAAPLEEIMSIRSSISAALQMIRGRAADDKPLLDVGFRKDLITWRCSANPSL